MSSVTLIRPLVNSSLRGNFRFLDLWQEKRICKNICKTSDSCASTPHNNLIFFVQISEYEHIPPKKGVGKKSQLHNLFYLLEEY